jgi:hypothetical protein
MRDDISSDAAIARLIEKAEADDWTPATAIDWNLKIQYPFWFRKRTYRSLVSQFHHGEKAVMRMCDHLAPRLEGDAARRFVALQRRDEAKHAEVYGAYAMRLGGIQPMEDALASVLAESQDWPGSAAGVILAFHMVFEGGAVALIEKLVRRFPCPLFAALNARILIDEARHVAFGRHYLAEHLPHMSADERIALYRWVQDLWYRAGAETRRRYTLPVAMVTRLGGDWLEAGWDRQAHLLIGIGLINEAERARLGQERR